MLPQITPLCRLIAMSATLSMLALEAAVVACALSHGYYVADSPTLVASTHLQRGEAWQEEWRVRCDDAQEAPQPLRVD